MIDAVVKIHTACIICDSLRKPFMLACKFWPIFQSLKSHNSVTTQRNAIKLCTSMAK